jgi:hypothetical protein
MVVYAVFLGTWAWLGHGFAKPDVGRPGADFAIFWAAAHLLLDGSALQVYDHHALISAELKLFGGFADRYSMPWVYPPAFLLVLAPLSLIPFQVAYLLFIGFGAFLFVQGTLSVSRLDEQVGSRRLAALYILASPCVFITAVVGQNSLLTAALAAFAIHWIVRSPIKAGACIGLLATKPQMAIVFPFVLVAARAWKAFLTAALTALAITALSGALCGVQSFHKFIANASVLQSSLLLHGEHFWLSSPTPYSALRSAGVPVVAAYVVHTAVALVAIWAACHVWRTTRDARYRASILAVSALIVSPYMWHYELPWLGIALACMCASGLSSRWLCGEQAVLALGWILPIYEHFNRLTRLPQVGAIVLLLTMLLILRRVRVAAQGIDV